jgi:hypothetical protein
MSSIDLCALSAISTRCPGSLRFGVAAVTAVMRSSGRRLARAMLFFRLVRWKPIAVLLRVAMTAGPLPVLA